MMKTFIIYTGIDENKTELVPEYRLVEYIEVFSYESSDSKPVLIPCDLLKDFVKTNVAINGSLIYYNLEDEQDYDEVFTEYANKEK